MYEFDFTQTCTRYSKITLAEPQNSAEHSLRTAVLNKKK